MNPFLLRNLFFPFYHQVKRTGVMAQLAAARRNQWLAFSELQELQKKKLGLLLIHAFNHVPFYQERFCSAGLSPADLDDPFDAILRLPLLTKQEINENRELMISKNGAGGRLIANSTSGSTGEALRFSTDMKSWATRRAIVIRNQEWLGVNLGDRQATLWGASIDIDKLKNIRGRIHRWFNNYVMLSSFDLSPEKMREYVECLKHFEPRLLTSYPGPLTELAGFMLRHNLTVPSLKAVISSAETLYPWQREVIERALSCKVYNRYGCREFGDIAHECECRQGLHVNADRCLVEIISSEGKPCQPGEPGEIVVTDLDNYGMPFIRYHIGDQARFAVTQCACGRGLPLLVALDGRSLDVIRSPNGISLGGTFWTILFRSRPGIKSFQVVQNELHGVVVKYVRAPDISEQSLRFFTEQIREKCGSGFVVLYCEVDRIEKTKSGKTRFVISNVAGDRKNTLREN